MPIPEFSVESPWFNGLPDAPDTIDVMPNIRARAHLYSLLDDEPTFEVQGYEYSPDLQPYVIELWDEKSGDVGVMRNLAHEHGINYQPGVGYASITNIKRMLKRVASYGKPARILYVSDLDDAGQNMPIQVGRHSQFGCWELTEIARSVAPEIMIDNAALTAEQVERLNLPQFTDTTKTEIDALEALYPGELERLLKERIEELQDTDLPQKVADARREAEEAVRNGASGVMEDHRYRIEGIEEEAQEVINRYRTYYRILGEKMEARYRRLGERYERHMADLKEQAREEHAEIEEELAELEANLPELPEAEVEDTSGWLFDSRRDFLDQTRRFRRAKGWE
jgi:hypothetical protein